MTFCRAAASLAAPQSVEENVPVMIFTPSRVASRVASEAAAVGSTASPDGEDQLLAHHAAEAAVDEVAHDLVALEVQLALDGEVARERLEHPDLVLAAGRLLRLEHEPAPSASATRPAITIHFTCLIPSPLSSTRGVPLERMDAAARTSGRLPR